MLRIKGLLQTLPVNIVGVNINWPKDVSYPSCYYALYLHKQNAKKRYEDFLELTKSNPDFTRPTLCTIPVPVTDRYKIMLSHEIVENNRDYQLIADIYSQYKYQEFHFNDVDYNLVNNVADFITYCDNEEYINLFSNLPAEKQRDILNVLSILKNGKINYQSMIHDLLTK